MDNDTGYKSEYGYHRMMAMNRDIGKAADIPFCVEKTHRFMEGGY